MIELYLSKVTENSETEKAGNYYARVSYKQTMNVHGPRSHHPLNKESLPEQSDRDFTLVKQILVEAEEGLQAAVDAAEAHESQGEQSGGEHHDGHALHALGDTYQFHLLAHTGKHSQRQAEADGRREGIDDTLNQVVVLLDHEDGDAEHGTVGRDERQEDAEGLIEGGRHFLQDDLHHLHQRGDDEDEGDGLQILKAEGVEHVFLYQPGDDGGERQHEGYCRRHAQRGLDLLGYAEERTDAQEL